MESFDSAPQAPAYTWVLVFCHGNGGCDVAGGQSLGWQLSVLLLDSYDLVEGVIAVALTTVAA